MKSALRITIIPLSLIMGVGFSGCVTQGQIRTELESEEGRALIMEVVEEGMRAAMESEEHRAEMREMMARMMEELNE